MPGEDAVRFVKLEQDELQLDEFDMLLARLQTPQVAPSQSPYLRWDSVNSSASDGKLVSRMDRQYPVQAFQQPAHMVVSHPVQQFIPMQGGFQPPRVGPSNAPDQFALHGLLPRSHCAAAQGSGSSGMVQHLPPAYTRGFSDIPCAMSGCSGMVQHTYEAYSGGFAETPCAVSE